MRSTSGNDRRGVRAVLRAVLAAVVVVLFLAAGTGAAAAVTAPLNCTPMGDPACKDLTPIVECLWNNGDGTSTIVWGYDNPSTRVILIEVGGKNKMSPGADDQGQPTTFATGLHRNEFITTVSGTSRTWTLGNNKVSSSSSTPACATKPVPLVGSVRALLVGLLIMALIGLPAVGLRGGTKGIPA